MTKLSRVLVGGVLKLHDTTVMVVKVALATVAIVTLGAGVSYAQSDPGPRGGAAGAGGAFPALSAAEKAFFAAATEVFAEVDSVSGTIEDGRGLGPMFNSNGCASCHAQPATGGTSPAPFSPQVPQPNPQTVVANVDGATNTIPTFITANGPVREARFVSTNPSDTNAPLDGGVHALFTIKGRTDAPGCNLAQPNFAAQLAAGNVIFRIPTPLFGLGLIENTSDATLQANLAANASLKAALGIAGRFNQSGNDGTITRFGWKAQNKSLEIFAMEAYNVEQGVTNEGFPNERSTAAGCVFNTTPEDLTHITNPNTGGSTGTTTEMSADIVTFAAFMRLAAPPTPAASTTSITNGSNLFTSTGCAMCHTPSLTTSSSPFTGMSNFTYHPFSDIALHHMGSNLTDGVNQGGAGPDEFRTAPLWGLGQRLFFLHDGRTTNLITAIQAHFSPGNVCTTIQSFQQFSINNGMSYFQPYTSTQNCGSEANATVNNFNALSTSQKQDLLNFLRSL
jgi:CxxC motif-containing protein (DUF1111 family)